jgi:hypothetical protein
VTATPPPPPPALPIGAPRPRKYQVGPILITLFGGIVLAAGSCVGFLGALGLNGGTNSSNPLSLLWAVGFFVGLASAGAGFVWAIAAIIMFLIDALSVKQ